MLYLLASITDSEATRQAAYEQPAFWLLIVLIGIVLAYATRSQGKFLEHIAADRVERKEVREDMKSMASSCHEHGERLAEKTSTALDKCTTALASNQVTQERMAEMMARALTRLGAP